jgi:cytochrome c-type biogenesis protein CcmH/NrfF
MLSPSLHATIILWVAGSALVIAVIGAIVFARRRTSDDLGSVSAAWTTEHTVGYRGGDGLSG